MLKLQIIGNLGADAEKKNVNGREFVSFRVAHTFKASDGSESTTWVSCAMNGNGGAVLQYLTRGTKVFVSGRPRIRVYSSPKTHQMEAGIDLSVESIELCGTRAEVTADNVRAWLTSHPAEASEIVNELPF